MKNPLLPPVIEQMLQPDFYPHAVTEPIQLVQTHISFLLLTGEYVYKIKKSVKFDFLDYSTLEKRQHFCQAELRMNQRTAPEIYLEVVAICQVSDRFQIRSTGEVVEYAVKMHQFPQEALLIEMFEQGSLTEEHLQVLGKVVANFHQQTYTNEQIRRFGEVKQIQAEIDKNYEQSQPYIGGPQTEKQFQETKAYTDQFFQEQPALFEQRIKNDKIRECHGDLHLKNIAFWQNKMILFDCIEFNEAFRFVDVMYDVAFTVMDLEVRKRKDLSNIFLNTYFEETGDWEGLQVLPMYLSRQAYVRAKVTSFLLDDPGISPAEKAQAEQTARDYYTLAWQYTQRSQCGSLILMSGLSGSGKSTVARSLARNINAVHIRSDAVRKHLAGVSLYERGSEQIYTPEMNQKTYQRVLGLGVMLARQGWSVILDAKYDRQADRREAIAAAHSHHLPLQILHCTAPMEVLRDRLHQRQGDIADATAELLDRQQASAETFTAEERVYVQEIDTTHAIAPQLQALSIEVTF